MEEEEEEDAAVAEAFEELLKRDGDAADAPIGVDDEVVEVAMAATAAAASATRASSIADADSRLGFGGGLKEAPGGRGALP